MRITDHDALRKTGRRRVKLDDPAHKSEIVEEAVQRVQWVGDITGRPMSTNHPDTGIVDLILDMDSNDILPAPVSRHLARGDFGIPVMLHGLQHPEHNPYLVIRQTAALPQSLAVTTRDTCLCHTCAVLCCDRKQNAAQPGFSCFAIGWRVSHDMS